MIHADFLDIDYRKKRDPRRGLVSTDALTIHKHEILLPRDIVAGKSILDLGCFHGATGDWCLRNNAAHYTGLEINRDFSEIAYTLMDRHHHAKPWEVINQGFDQFFDKDSRKFDIIFAWGVLHHTFDHTWFLKELSKRADHIIIGARTPKCLWRDMVLTDEYVKKLEYDIAYTEYFNGDMSLMYSPGFAVKCTSANSSLAAVKMIMALNGFEADLTAYEHFKKLQPNDFGMFADWDKPGFYIIDFRKTVNTELHTYEQMHYDPDLIVRFR